MLQNTDHKHIVIDDETSTAYLEGTRFKVRELVKEHLAYGWSADELQAQHPLLTLAQAYAALAYFYDHEAEFRNEIKQGLSAYETALRTSHDSPARRKLRSLGLI